MISKDLLDRISVAISWGAPDRESLGMSHAELISLLSEAKTALTTQPLPAAVPPAPETHDEINMPDDYQEQAALLESTQRLLAARTSDVEKALVEVRELRQVNRDLVRKVQEASARKFDIEQANRRLEKIRKHLSGLEDVING